jgi:hypothetical protein
MSVNKVKKFKFFVNTVINFRLNGYEKQHNNKLPDLKATRFEAQTIIEIKRGISIRN